VGLRQPEWERVSWCAISAVSVRVELEAPSLGHVALIASVVVLAGGQGLAVAAIESKSGRPRDLRNVRPVRTARVVSLKTWPAPVWMP